MTAETTTTMVATKANRKRNRDDQIRRERDDNNNDTDNDDTDNDDEIDPREAAKAAGDLQKLAAFRQQPKPQQRGKSGNDDKDDGNDNDDSQAKKKQKKKGRKNTHVKDPSEAADYLAKWQQTKNKKNDGDGKTKTSPDASSVGAWKFNKNTQSWLIRHMYEPEKIPKQIFGVLLEYIQQGGTKLRERVADDAKRRAKRYKEFEKSKEAEKEKEKEMKKDTSDKPTADSQSTGDNATNDVTEGDGGAKSEADDKATDPSKTAADEDDASRWAKLDAHGKRKEYKRARKALETLQS